MSPSNNPWTNVPPMPRKPPEPTFRGKCGDRAGGGYPTLLSTVATRKGRQRARNRYAGSCCFCGSRVEAGAGCIEKSQGQWVVFC